MLGSRIFRVLRFRSLGSASRRAILVGQKIRCSNTASSDQRPRLWSTTIHGFQELLNDLEDPVQQLAALKMCRS
jgi:hypothetical protein